MFKQIKKINWICIFNMKIFGEKPALNRDCVISLMNVNWLLNDALLTARVNFAWTQVPRPITNLGNSEELTLDRDSRLLEECAAKNLIVDVLLSGKTKAPSQCIFCATLNARPSFKTFWPILSYLSFYIL